MSNLSNYPPGVTGNEYQIAGPDFEETREDISCPSGHSPVFVQGYKWERWGWCFDSACDFFIDATDNGSNSFQFLEEDDKVEVQEAEDAWLEMEYEDRMSGNYTTEVEEY